MKMSRNQEFTTRARRAFSVGFVLLYFVLGFGFLETPLGRVALEAVGFEDPRWKEMVTTISTILDNYDGEVGVYIKDLKTGKVFEKNADQKFLSASLIKLPIMAATYQAVKEGKITLNTGMKYQRKHRKGGSGVMRYYRLGRRFPVSFVIYKMITRSDNTATAMLIDRLGYDYINRSFKEFGLATTRIDPVGMRLSDYIHPARDNYTTPREMASLLEKIYERKLVSDGLSDLMMEILKDAASPSRLGRFLPPKWDFARKTGLLRKNCHDVGIVFSENSDYLICVLTRKNETYRQAKGLIASVGRTAYSYLDRS